MAIAIVIFSVIVTFFVIFDLIPIFQQKQFKAFWVYIVLISFSYVLSLLLVIDIKLPSPAEPLKKLVSFVFGLNR